MAETEGSAGDGAGARPRAGRKRTDKDREAERRRYAAQKDDPERIEKRRATRRARYARDPSLKRTQDRKYLEERKDDPEFKEKRRESVRAFRLRNPGKASEYYEKRRDSRSRTEEEIEAGRERSRARYARVKDQPGFKETNRARVREHGRQNPHLRREWDARRRSSDPLYRVMESLRGRMRQAVRRAADGKKARKTIALIGCSIEHLRSHLESMFRHGMTWENYGRFWHVDHKLPCASFDMTDPAQQLRCFHYTNLQPLLAAENLGKAASV